ncbi:MAG: RNA polymerase factor sigma-70 [Mariniblastus sp.]
MGKSNSQDDRYQRFVGLLALNDQAIRRFIRSLLPSTQGLDDVVQETALECWRKFSDFELGDADHPDQTQGSDEFIRWACVIARFKVMSCQRDWARDRLVFREHIIEQFAEDAFEQIENRDLERMALEDCLSQLVVESRRLLLSVYRPGDSVKRIARESGEKSRRLYRKMNGLRKQLLNCVERRLAEES